MFSKRRSIGDQLRFISSKRAAVALAILASMPVRAAQPADQLRLGYLATFANGSFNPVIDQVGFGPMQTGDSQVPDIDASWTPQGAEMVLEVTRPATATGGPVAVGVFATPVNFGPGTVFEEHATYIKPAGPHQTGNIWAATVEARTGGNEDLDSETRIAATLQVRGTALRLNALGAAVPTRIDLPQDVYDEIFSPTDPQPFTLELLVDRVSGSGRVSLKIDDRIFSRDANFPAFAANSGSVITAVGPTLAIASASGQTASVHLREFRMFLPSSGSSASATASCPDGWAEFNCRGVPDSH
jgi:hypothetical protein